MRILHAATVAASLVEAPLNRMIRRHAVFTLLGGVAALIACEDTPTGPLAQPQSETAQELVGIAGSGSGLSPTETLLTFAVIDPTGDNTGDIDLLKMETDFNPATGDYEIRLEADPASPFLADFRVNINMFNVDDATFFLDVLNDFDLASATTTLTLSGNSSQLTGWEEGDNVHTNSLCNRGPNSSFFCSTFDVPNPPGVSLFRSSVSSFPSGFLSNEDVIAFLDYAQTAVVEELTAQLRTDRLASDVQSLVDAGILGQDPADGLLEKLDELSGKIDAGKTRAAINQMRAFTNQVNGLVPNQLTPVQAQELIDRAEAVIAQLSS